MVAIVSDDEKPRLEAIATTAPDLPYAPGKHATLARDHELRVRRHGQFASGHRSAHRPGSRTSRKRLSPMGLNPTILRQAQAFAFAFLQTPSRIHANQSPSASSMTPVPRTRHGVFAPWIVRRHAALVGEENLHPPPVDVFQSAQRFMDGFRRIAAGEGGGEGASLRYGGRPPWR
jgi:hypothetical protein